MDYKDLTSEIMVPDNWPTYLQKEIFTGIRQHLINIVDNSKAPVFLRIETVETITFKIIRSTNAAPEIIFLSTQQSINDETFVVTLMLPTQIEVLNDRSSSFIIPSVESFDKIPMKIVPDISNHGITFSSTHQKRYLIVVPDTKKFLKSLGITAPKYAVKTSFTIRQGNLIMDEINNIDQKLSISAGSITYLDRLEWANVQEEPSIRTAPQPDQCFVAGSLEHTIHALQCEDPSQVEDAARAAADILYDSSPLDIQPALDKGILDALVPALTEGSDACKENATAAIWYLCLRGSPAQLRVLAASAALQPYCRLLAAADWRNTCHNVLCGLTHWLRRSEQTATPALLQQLRALGVPQLLMTVWGGGFWGKDNRQIANDLLRTYFLNNQ